MSRVSAGATSEPNRSFDPSRFRIFPRINVNNTAAAGVHERVYGPRRGTRRDPVAIWINLRAGDLLIFMSLTYPAGIQAGLPSVANKNP